jgi:hypothetical protein
MPKKRKTKIAEEDEDDPYVLMASEVELDVVPVTPPVVVAPN